MIGTAAVARAVSDYMHRRPPGGIPDARPRCGRRSPSTRKRGTCHHRGHLSDRDGKPDRAQRAPGGADAGGGRARHRKDPPRLGSRMGGTHSLKRPRCWHGPLEFMSCGLSRVAKTLFNFTRLARMLKTVSACGSRPGISFARMPASAASLRAPPQTWVPLARADIELFTRINSLIAEVPR